LKLGRGWQGLMASSRLPPGRRGLKPSVSWKIHDEGSRLPPGRRGLKPVTTSVPRPVPSRLPPGRRGLKLLQRATIQQLARSPSPRKAWIETPECC